MFDILHHSQLVFSAEMSDQLTALSLTFHREMVKQMQVLLTRPGQTDRQTDRLLDSYIYRSVVFISSAPRELSASPAIAACRAISKPV